MNWGTKAIAGIVIISLLPLLASCTIGEKASPKPQRFALAGEAFEFIKEKPLQNRTVQQSFAIDNVNRHIYFLQVMAGGMQLPGEKGAVSYADRSLNGDLTVTKLDFSGDIVGAMYLKGFGHGV